jgi:hypothetical protein
MPEPAFSLETLRITFSGYADRNKSVKICDPATTILTQGAPEKEKKVLGKPPIECKKHKR